MREYREYGQVLTLSDIGGTVTGWQYRGEDIFFPQQEVMRGGVVKTRGGMHACWPCFGTPNVCFNLPQHGVLRNRKADAETENGFVFRGTDLLGPARDEESEVRVAVELTQGGFVYTLSARLLEPAKDPVFVNAGLHPYFRTPTGNVQAGAWVGQKRHFYRHKQEPMLEDVGKGAELTIPGIGEVKMLLGGAWSGARTKKLVFWRDSREYLCVEPILGAPKLYGSPAGVPLTEEWLEMRCSFHVALD